MHNYLAALKAPRLPVGVESRLASNLVEELWFGEDDAEDAKDRAKASLAGQMALVRGLRPFPVAATRLIQIMSNANYDPDDVVAALESDPGLAAKTLAMANSPLFRMRTACLSLRDAVRRLGGRQVRDLAVGISTMSIAGAGRRECEAFRDHSVGVAAVARVMADLALPDEASTVFLAGLLHEIGKLLLLQTSEFDYGGAEQCGEEIVLREREVLGFDHAVLGGCAVRLWRIPGPIADIVAWHHQPARAMAQDGRIGTMVALVRAAERIDRALASGDELDARARRALAQDGDCTYAELNDADLHLLWPEMRTARSEMLRSLAR